MNCDCKIVCLSFTDSGSETTEPVLMFVRLDLKPIRKKTLGVKKKHNFDKKGKITQPRTAHFSRISQNKLSNKNTRMLQFTALHIFVKSSFYYTFFPS